MGDFLTTEELEGLDAYWRASNYLAVGQIYLKRNPLLETPLSLADIKPRLLGHWGTTPGLNLIYTHLNRLINQYDLNMLFVAGPGHGGPAVVAQTYLEGTYTECYPSVERNSNGLLRLFRQFSWPYGISSHVSAQIPGSIHEGGELGYCLAHAYGAAFDNPDLIVACVIGDGEAETGPLAASWHSNKFLNPARDGAVLPILHLNGYKIANPRCCPESARMSCRPCCMGMATMRISSRATSRSRSIKPWPGPCTMVLKIREIQHAARQPSRNEAPQRQLWPVLVLRTPKGWTGPKFVDGCRVEGTWRAHQVPLAISRRRGMCSNWKSGSRAIVPRSCSMPMAPCCPTSPPGPHRPPTHERQPPRQRRAVTARPGPAALRRLRRRPADTRQPAPRRPGSWGLSCAT
jgi:xylulose-5-phosphate/fructose-6-phosphate phosphoketolase